MKPDSIHALDSISQAGSFARSCLTAGQHGQVLAAFSKAIYLQAEAGELFWLSTQDAPMHRRCARVSGELPAPSAGSRYQVHGHGLKIDKDIALELDGTIPWDEPGRVPAMDISSLDLHVQEFFATLNTSQARGFGTFIPQLLSLSKGKPVDLGPNSKDPVLAHARPLVMDLAQACLEDHQSDVLKCSRRLAGLGSGLTPSGDDFLGGMAFVNKILKVNYPELDLLDFISEVDYYQPLTHPISFILLSDLVSGHAIAPLHQMMNGLLCGKSIEDLHLYFSQLTFIGHSTGWDLLAGFLAGLLIISQSHYCIPSFKTIHNIEI
jgi:hypothetical protein